MNTELILRQDLIVGELTAGTYATLTGGGVNFLDFNTVKSIDIPSGTVIYVYQFDGTFIGTFTVDELTGGFHTDHYEWEININETYNFDALAGFVTLNPGFTYDTKVDLFEEATIPINFNISNFDNIASKNSSYSLTLKIPGTEANNVLFKHLYQIEMSNSFKLNIPVNCYVLSNSYKIFEGNFILTKVVRNNKSTVYEGTIYSDTKTLFDLMSDKLMYGNPTSSDDLDFSAANHTLSTTAIKNSWTSGDTYVYVPIDKFNKYSQTFEDSGTYKNEQMTPSLYVKKIWDVIFAKYGFTYTSDFLNNATQWKNFETANGFAGNFDFSKLIYPNVKSYMEYSKNELDEMSAIVGDEVEISTLSCLDSNPSFSVSTSSINKFPTSYADLNLNYDNSTGYFTAPEPGWYNISGDLSINIALYTGMANTIIYGMPLSGSWPSTASLAIRLDFIKNIGGIGTDIIIKQENGSPMTSYQEQKFNNPGGYLSDVVGKITFQKLVSITSEEIWLDSGDTIKIKTTSQLNYRDSPSNAYMFRYNDGTAFGGTVPITAISTFGPDDREYCLKVARISDSGLINPTKILGTNMKQSEFILGIIKMFNLYIEPIDTKKLLIEPQQYFFSDETKSYSSGNSAINVDDAMDLSKEIDIEKVSNLDEKDLYFKYVDDNDYFLDLYKKQSINNIEYSEYIKYKLINGEKSETIIELPFAPIVCGTYNNPDNGDLNSNECPKIFNTDADGYVEVANDYKQRILYYQGKILIPSTGIDSTKDGYLILQDKDGNIDDINATGYYPCASTFDKPYGNDEHSLDFATNNKYWVEFNGTTATYQNLYYMFYKHMIDEILNYDTKLITLYLYLTDRFMYLSNSKFSFSYMINGIKYRLNKIENYVPNTVCKVELIKIP